MFRIGHYGVSLALYAPLGGLLLAGGHPTAAVAGGAAVCWLAMLPDVDHRIPGVSHRGPTHTLAFAALVGGATWTAASAGASATGLGGLSAGPAPLPAFAGGIAAFAVLAHLVGDLLTPMGVALLWPVSGRRYSLSVTPADSTTWNYGLFALGVFATAAAAYLGSVVATGGPLPSATGAATLPTVGGATTLFSVGGLLPV
ncbi:metal-dependent hydrolase [Halorussus limi]|uniref:Metal-dependent hydrolase n=1 Tax=Halorussus limi TaxID=2938695 RepID=A0A8U0HV73_9EURY|nr:metal-dependent hydrolase [Halorussus limi]UPV74817.1 metal-dependent hydrolase [Halorussus limi]